MKPSFRLATVLLGAVSLSHLVAQTVAQPAVQPAKLADPPVKILPIKGNIWMLVAGGSNIVASIGKDGILVVNTGPVAVTDKLLAAVQELSRRVTAAQMPQQVCVGVGPSCAWWSSSTFTATTAAPPAAKPIVGIINTSLDADHVGGNAAFSRAGRSHVGIAVDSAWIIAHENANPVLREERQKSAVKTPSAALPTETYSGAKFKLNHFNGEAVVLWHMPAAHSDGDTIVQFVASDVLVAGDIFDMASYPVIDVANGGSIQGMIDGMNWLLDTAVVEHMMEGGTMVVPGHGRLADSADLAYYRDMLTIVRDRVRGAVKKGMTLEQVKAAKLTIDYDGRFGRNPVYTPALFIEGVYRSLNTNSVNSKKVDSKP